MVQQLTGAWVRVEATTQWEAVVMEKQRHWMNWDKERGLHSPGFPPPALSLPQVPPFRRTHLEASMQGSVGHALWELE